MFCVPRSIRALNTRYNFVPPTRLRRITTPGRIVKYCHRGFGSLLFGTLNTVAPSPDFDR